jgi:hypothetical protein
MLKRVEAIAAAYRYVRYRKSSKIGKRLERLINAIRELRPLLDHELAYVKGQNEGDPGWWMNHGSDAYYGEEVRAMQIATACMDLADCVPGEPPGITLSEFALSAENLLTAGQSSMPRLPWASGQRQQLQLQAELLQTSAGEAKGGRHADLRAALLENPDQPQATFVARFHVHPITVRECRRELEEAGAIPFLAHRHGLSNAHLAEADD